MSYDDEGFFFTLVPARVLSATCLTDDRRKQHFFGPRRSDRILQHDTTHGHDLTGCYSSPARGSPPRAFTSRLRGVAWRAVSICVIAPMNSHESIFPARMLDGIA